MKVNVISKNTCLLIFSIHTTLIFAKNWSLEDQIIYDKLFPHYVETCAIAKLDAKGAKGNNFGHSIMFIRGVCLDKNSFIPQLKICTQDNKDSFPIGTQGVGISVSPYFGNINWIGFPGRYLFFFLHLLKIIKCKYLFTNSILIWFENCRARRKPKSPRSVHFGYMRKIFGAATTRKTQTGSV